MSYPYEECDFCSDAQGCAEGRKCSVPEEIRRDLTPAVTMPDPPPPVGEEGWN